MLEQVVAGKLVNNRPIQIRKTSDSSALRACHMIFVPLAETRRFLELSTQLAASGIVTVGESEGFASQGGVINFIVEDNKVRFEINTRAAARAQIRLSSRLLQLATIVSDERRK
jgi:hypothetical protein